MKVKIENTGGTPATILSNAETGKRIPHIVSFSVKQDTGDEAPTAQIKMHAPELELICNGEFVLYYSHSVGQFRALKESLGLDWEQFGEMIENACEITGLPVDKLTKI